MSFRRVRAQARRDIDRDGPTFSIVTPVLNGGHLLDETIASIVTQAGSFRIRYHIQDAASTDGTVQRLEAWSRALATGFPILCGGVDFSFNSAPDRGLYDGVRRGFEACGGTSYMSWLNADDRYEAGAFQSVAEVFSKFDDVLWLSGRPLIISETGAPGQLVHRRLFARSAIAAGVYDGRASPFLLQQEGMFWRSELYQSVGGVDAGYRLAGDFDLWRRFAEQTDLVVVDALLAAFRVRVGQLSSGSKYHEELDAKFDAGMAGRRAELAGLLRADLSDNDEYAAGFLCRMASNHPYGEGWKLVRYLISYKGD
jgi:glycosyltransferase involved in cell wall biosynthesis